MTEKRSATARRILLLVIGLLIAGVAVWQFYKYRIANRGIHDAVTGKSGGLYRIHYDDLTFDELGGSVHMKNIVIAPDTEVYHRLLEEKANPAVLLTLHLPALDITGVKTPKALLTRELQGGRIVIDSPVIELAVNPARQEADTSAVSDDPVRDMARQLLGKLAKISVDSVQLNHATLSIRDMQTGDIVYRFDNVDLSLSELLIDPGSHADTSRILFSRGFSIACEKLLFPSKKKKYKTEIEQLRYASLNNSLEIGRMRVEPQYSEEEFARISRTQIDRYDFLLENIRLSHIDRRSFWSRIIADSLVVGNSSFKVYHDLSYPRDSVSKVGKYPQQLLMKLGLPLSIRTAVFTHSFIEYKEKNPKSGHAGKVQFFDVRAVIGNITNMPAGIARNDQCVVSLHASFLRAAPLNARLVLLLKDEKGRFHVSGDMGSLDVHSLNPLSEPMGLARMEKGEVEHTHFDLDCDDSSATGKVEILYKELRISVLKADKEEDKLDKRGLASLAASVMIKRSNPSGKEQPRISEVHYPRILNRSMFALIWKSIFTGVKETVGMK
ncbi:MAG: hypothetical protein Q8943_07195 [Bacteroidota bacterium]|nr:hypothetical protein [Bacteroidota bacterium]